MKKIDVNMKVLIAIIALFGLSLSLMAQTQQRQCQFNQRDQYTCAALDLADDQKAEIKEVRLAKLKKIQPLKDEAKINKAKINALVNKDNPDMKKIVSLVEANGKIMTQMQVIKIDGKIKVRALLTDEQKVIFDARNGQFQKNRAIPQYRQQRRSPNRCRF